MSLANIDFYFREYVAKMRADVEREIDLAAVGKDSGNFLCALALVVYTEALGRVRRWNDDPLNFRATDDRA